MASSGTTRVSSWHSRGSWRDYRGGREPPPGSRCSIRAMTRAVRIHRPGGPEELRLDDVPLDEPRSGEALVRHTAIGVNYIDVYHRTGLYPLPALPHTLGVEAAGVVE